MHLIINIPPTKDGLGLFQPETLYKLEGSIASAADEKSRQELFDIHTGKAHIGDRLVIRLPVTDDEIRILPDSDELQSLTLKDFKLTAVGIKHLQKHFPNLKHLDLSHCENVTDAAIKILTPLNLESLNLSGCDSITNEGLNEIGQNFKTLKNLNLSNLKKISSVHFLSFFMKSDVPKLEMLELKSTHTTDAVLMKIGKIKSLKALNIYDCRGVSSEGLKYLKDLANVTINIGNTELIKAALPYFTDSKNVIFI